MCDSYVPSTPHPDLAANLNINDKQRGMLAKYASKLKQQKDKFER